jgi:hypothetical protein
MDWMRAKADNGERMLEARKYSGKTLPDPCGSNNNSTGGLMTNYDANFVTASTRPARCVAV